MALAEGVLQILEDASQKQAFTRVKTVWLEIGRLSSVEPEAMRFCFDAVTRGSLAEGARLEVIDTPGTGRCLSCGAEVEIVAVYDACPLCGEVPVEPLGGTEMRVKELEVE